MPLTLGFDALTLAHLYAVLSVHGTLLVFFNLAEVAALPQVVVTTLDPVIRREGLDAVPGSA